MTSLFLGNYWFGPLASWEAKGECDTVNSDKCDESSTALSVGIFTSQAVSISCSISTAFLEILGGSGVKYFFISPVNDL